MAVGGAAKRYAQAAFELARDHNALDIWERDLDALAEAFENPAVEGLFTSPAVPDSAKQETLQRLLPADEQRLIRNFVLLLLERGRLDQLPRIVEAFKTLALEERGIAIADVTTAVELNPADADLVKQHVRELIGKDVELRTHVDPEIIGGVVVGVGDMLFDGSVRTQLQQLRQQLAR